MIYLDYSASTPVDKRVLDYYYEYSLKYFSNPNSLHKLGKFSADEIRKSSKKILSLLKVDNYDVIYTSGATESNNLALKGIAFKNINKGNHIITSSFEHSSIVASLSYLQKQGFTVDVVKVDKNGQVDLEDLKNLINEKTILVSICSVNSEIGIIQPIDKISKIVRGFKNCVFHSDMTQSIGKIDLNYSDVDLISFTAHKFYGIKGIGCLLKRDDLALESQIHGGESTTKFRSGTPSMPLICSLAKALELALDNLESKFMYVESINEEVKKKLLTLENVVINSNDKCIPHILNISVLNSESSNTVLQLEKSDVFISNYTACSSNSKESLAVYNLTKNKSLSTTSVRISLSHLTTKKEINRLYEEIKKVGK